MRCGKNNDSDVVAAHRNETKGIGIKVSDAWVAFICGECHSIVDNGKDLTREERRTEWFRAYANTMKWLLESGRLTVK